jgi:hypothetical protein
MSICKDHDPKVKTLKLYKIHLSSKIKQKSLACTGHLWRGLLMVGGRYIEPLVSYECDYYTRPLLCSLLKVA